jgi:hypothetical protein
LARIRGTGQLRPERQKIADPLLLPGADAAAKPDLQSAPALYSQYPDGILDRQVVQEKLRQALLYGKRDIAAAPHLSAPHVDDEIGVPAEQDTENEHDDRSAGGEAEQQEPEV